MTPDEERAALVEEFRARNRERDELEQIKALSRDELPPQEPLPPVDPVDIPPYREPEGAAQGNPYSGMSEPEYQAETADRVAVRQFGGAGGAPPADVVERRAWLDAHAAPSDPDYPPAAPPTPQMPPGGQPPQLGQPGAPPRPVARPGGGGQGYYQRGVPDVQPVDREKVGAELEALELDRLAGRVDTATYRRKKQEFLSLLDPTKADVARNMTPQQLIAAGMRSKHAAEQAALSGEMAGLDAQSAAAVGRQASIQDALGQVDETQREYAAKRDKYERYFEDQMERYQVHLENFRTEKIDPERYWKQRGGFAQAIGIIAIGLGSLGSSMSKGRTPNVALQMINRAIDRDIDAQKADMARAGRALAADRGLISVWQRALGDLPQAEAAARIQIYDVLSKKIDAMTSGYQSPALKAKAEALKQQLGHAQEAERANLLAQFKLGAQKAAADAARAKPMMAGGWQPVGDMSGSIVGNGNDAFLVWKGGRSGTDKLRDKHASYMAANESLARLEQLVNQPGWYMNPKNVAEARQLKQQAVTEYRHQNYGAALTATENKEFEKFSFDVDSPTEIGAQTLPDRVTRTREFFSRAHSHQMQTYGATPIQVGIGVTVDPKTRQEREGPVYRYVRPDTPQGRTVQPAPGAAK